MNREAMSVEAIDARVKDLKGWSHKAGKLKKNFIFDDFTEAFAFMTQMAIKAEKIDHHPEWFNVYNKLDVDLATHDPKGISELDFFLAEQMNEIESHKLKKS